jgi:VIT1/CCC1 family predicted Fe2+/Mn2+ transporter
VAGMVEWVRPHILEASDGILTSAGICEGLAGAGVRSSVLIFAGLTGLLAGALALGATEYSKAAVERDQQEAELTRERAQLETAPDAELDELAQLYVLRGLSPDLARQVAIELTAHDALQAHAEAEHGITPATLAAPRQDAIAAGTAFAAGAAIPLLSIGFIPGAPRALLTFLIVLIALALTGWVAARISDVHPLRPIARTAGTGVLSMVISYTVGHLLHP